MKVLVHLLGSLGDCLVSLPSLRAVERHFSDLTWLSILHERRLGVPVAPREVLNGNARVNEFIGYNVPLRSWLSRYRIPFLSMRLRLRKFDAVISLLPSEREEKQFQRDRLFFRASGIKKFYGFEAFSPEVIYPRDAAGYPARTSHEALFRLVRLQRNGIDISAESKLDKPFFFPRNAAGERALAWLMEVGLKPGQKIIAIGPGAKKKVSLWPLRNFVEIGQRIQKLGDYKILVIGGEGERDAGRFLAKEIEGAINAAGVFDVHGTAAVLKQCSFLIGLDTGSTHLAAAVGTPCVALYSGVDHAGKWDPLGRGHIVLRHLTECSPCQILWGDCPVVGHPCMTGISTEVVWSAVFKMHTRVADALTSRSVN